jgi:hypothetical protein
MRRAAIPLTAAVIVALMLAGAYAMGAYVPAGAPRVVATWGTADAVEVVGIRAQVLRGVRARVANDTAWASALRVVVEQASSGPQLPQVIGRYLVLGNRIRFEPRFPFAPGVEYRVELDPQRLEQMAGLGAASAVPRVTHRFSVPAAVAARTTRVVAVQPSVDRVPSNMLRWYVEFSSPMEPGTAHEHVQVLDEAGRPVEDAFLRVGEELWDNDRRRLTLLFDPGRVKRGVRTNLEVGAPLVAGHRYRLVIDAAWRDAAGAALASGFDKEFDVGPSDRTSPDPARWELTVPHAGTRDALRVAFTEALDHALARRMLTVESGGRTLEGRVTLGHSDRAWAFVPEAPWKAGTYSLRIDAALEDLAGNSVARVFDADRQRGAPPAEEGARLGGWRTVEFRVGRVKKDSL